MVGAGDAAGLGLSSTRTEEEEGEEVIEDASVGWSCRKERDRRSCSTSMMGGVLLMMLGLRLLRPRSRRAVSMTPAGARECGPSAPPGPVDGGDGGWE